MISVIVADEDSCDRHFVTFSYGDDVVNRVGRIHDETLPRIEITDEVDIVRHRLCERIRGCEVAAAEELTEVGAR